MQSASGMRELGLLLRAGTRRIYVYLRMYSRSVSLSLGHARTGTAPARRYATYSALVLRGMRQGEWCQYGTFVLVKQVNRAPDCVTCLFGYVLRGVTQYLYFCACKASKLSTCGVVGGGWGAGSCRAAG